MTIQSIDGKEFNLQRSGEGSPLVLVHGVGADLESWDGVARELGEVFDIIRYDQRGHGRSHRPSGPYKIRDFVNDLRLIMAANGLQRAHIAGFSLGGMVAQGLAIEYPQLVDRLVLISTVAGRTTKERERVQARADKLAQQGVDAHLNDAVDRWFTDEFIATHPDLLEWRRQKSMQNDPECYAAAYWMLADSDFGAELHRISAPTLVMTGECDIGSNPRMARLIKERIPNCNCTIFPRLKHSVLLEAPDRVAAEMSRFLTD